MKILLISLPRTGSTSLLNIISKEKKLISICEPFNEKNGNLEIYKNYNWENVNNICVKTHINHKSIKFYLKYIKFFDEVILLSRRNLTECGQSLAHASYFENFVEKYDWINTPNLNENIKFIIKFNEELIKLSNIINVKIIYYEDIFDINSNDRLRKNKQNLI
jgi:hypothetical protein